VTTLEGRSSCGNATPLPTPPRPLSVYVIATTAKGTEAALDRCRAYARDLDANVIVLVPHVVPYPQPLDQPVDSPAFAGERVGTVAAGLGLPVTIRVCVCRCASAVTRLLSQDALVLVGGRRRWWRSREERLVATLTRAGFHALLVTLRVPQTVDLGQTAWSKP
jgi:hypothetical protein